MLLEKHLNRYYARLWYYFALGILALIVVDYVQLFEPIYLGQIVDHLSQASGGVDIGFIGTLCLKLLGVAVTMFGGRMLWRFMLFNASQRIESGLRREMFEKSERLSPRYYQATNVGSIMSWFTTDLETLEEFTGFGTVQLVDSIFLGTIVVVRMYLADWVMATLTLAPMLLIVAWGALMEKFMAERWKDRQEKFDKMYDFAQENFTGISVIKAFVKEASEMRAFAKVAKKNQEANLAFVRVDVVFETLIEVIITVILSGLLGFGAWVVWATVQGAPVTLFGHAIRMTAGELITFIGYGNLLIWPMIALGSLVSMRGRAKASMKRVSAFLDAEEEIQSPADAVVLDDVRGGITFDHCTFAYPSAPEVKVLDDVCFSIRPGELVGVVGRVGSGKTTLLTLLLRLYNVEKGTVLIDGQDVMDCDLDSVRRVVAFVPQDNFLFSDSVKNNIAFGRDDATDEDVRRAAAFADVADNIEAFPDGYETVTGERGVTLSGGQKQRISLARAYLKDAPILVLDDSVSAVDVQTEERILANIRAERAGKTTVIIASRVSSVAHADRILVLHEGAVEAFDTPQNLMKVSPTYRKMVYLQELEREVKGGDA